MFLPDNSIFTPVADPNMDPSRTANRRLSVEERITSFDEVDATYTEEQALNESGRCLKCHCHSEKNAQIQEDQTCIFFHDPHIAFKYCHNVPS